MNIRSITYTIDFNNLENEIYLGKVEKNIKTLIDGYYSNHKSIRTIRFNVKPLNDMVINNADSFLNKVQLLSEFSKNLKVRWFNISFDLSGESKENVDILCEYSYEILKQFNNSFVNLITTRDFINNYAILKSSSLVKKISLLSQNGIDNFRLGVSMNIKPNTPFFPFSYSDNCDSFSIALETTQFLLDIISSRYIGNHMKLKENIIEEMGRGVKFIEHVSDDISNTLNILYNGLDMSLAPYQDENVSVVEILNRLGVENFGSNGTQFLTSYLTSILKEIAKLSDIKVVGFNGVMYSLLEDKLMCKSNNNNTFSIDSLILYSTVCGCGLDMIPLPGCTSNEEIASIMLDVATTSIKLDKPLGVRILPIPNKKSGEVTCLTLDFLTNTKILNIKNIHVDKNLFKNDKFYVKCMD